MQEITKLLSDIFSMRFDIILPLSGSILAFFIAVTVFLARYISYLHNLARYKKRRAAELKNSDARLPAVAAAKRCDPIVSALMNGALRHAQGRKRSGTDIL